MKRPATLQEAHGIVSKAKTLWGNGEGSPEAHRWHGSHSIWLVDAKDVAVPGGRDKLTIIGTGHFATTVFRGIELVQFINCRWDYLEYLHDTWACRLEYERVTRNGHLVWQASLA